VKCGGFTDAEGSIKKLKHQDMETMSEEHMVVVLYV